MTISQPDRLDQVESAMSGIMARLEAIDKKLEKLDVIDKRLENLDAIEKRLEKLDDRMFDFSMRVVTVNSTAYWSVAIALLSASIAFVVAPVSRGTP